MDNSEFGYAINILVNKLSAIFQEQQQPASDIDADFLGSSFTMNGPGEYLGNILDFPDMVWTEDSPWEESRIQSAEEKIKMQGDSIPDYWRQKYELKASTYWHEFYKRNKTNFYKDRHYLHVVFPELSPLSNKTASSITLLEVGCGVGNAIIPLLESNSNLNVIAIDFANSAIEILKRNDFCLTNRLKPYVCCMVKDELPVASDSVDIVLCMFVLSAISPMVHKEVLGKLIRVLKPGGKLLIRDYARYDEAQLRFKKGSKLGDNFYVRQDGTCAYYFDQSELRSLCCGDGVGTGLREEESYLITRQYANRLQKKARYRVWVQGKYVKGPASEG